MKRAACVVAVLALLASAGVASADEGTSAFDLRATFDARRTLASVLALSTSLGSFAGREWTLGDVLVYLNLNADGVVAEWRVAGPTPLVERYVEGLRQRAGRRKGILDLSATSVQVHEAANAQTVTPPDYTGLAGVVEPGDKVVDFFGVVERLFWKGPEGMAGFELRATFDARRTLASVLALGTSLGSFAGRRWTLADVLVDLDLDTDGVVATWRVVGPTPLVEKYVQGLRRRGRKRKGILDVSARSYTVNRAADIVGGLIGYASVEVQEGQVTGDLDKDVIGRTIERELSAIKLCYADELVLDRTLQGTITVSFTISRKGDVATATARSTMGAPEVESCVVAVVRTMKFPKPVGGGVVNASYPFVFKPDQY